MDKLIKFEIVTPERTVFSDEVLQVIVPTQEGEITVLPNHSPLVCQIKPGVLELKKPDGKMEVAFVAGGFIEVLHDKVVVLADSAERAEEIDLAKVEEARARAEEAMKRVRADDDEEFAAISAQLERELARTRAAKRWRNIKA